MQSRQLNILLFTIFSLFAVNFSAYTAMNFFGVEEQHYRPFLMYLNIIGFFVIVLPKKKGYIVEQLNSIIS
tara:strand:+ start:11473 stop:11685 length:213 start_codon:yes stop_codon:yes gene_type:complete